MSMFGVVDVELSSGATRNAENIQSNYTSRASSRGWEVRVEREYNEFRNVRTGEVSLRERHNSDCIFHDRKEGGGIAFPLISGSVGII